ncbi:MAG: Uma2 family endonuclease [Oscillochloridaceae bacterium umkhey_bin13]
MITLPSRKRFTVDDFARMREAGLLSEDDRIELLDGEIYVMSPVGPLHVAIVNKLNRILSQQLGDEAIVSVQNPIRLGDTGEPQPDLALLQPRADFYTTALATPAEILLLIEVADTSLAYDREQKLPRYAEAAISEVWIVDLASQTIEQYTQPLQGRYTLVRTILFGETIRATLLTGINVQTDILF